MARGHLPEIFHRVGGECYGTGRCVFSQEEEDDPEQRNTRWNSHDRLWLYMHDIASFKHFFFLVKSFVELVRAIFEMDGPKFFLSEHLCQDPLEKFFGCQRQRGRVNENPNVQSFCKNTQALRVIGSLTRNAVKDRGNCRGSNSKKREPTPLQEIDNESLPKRKKERSKA